MLGGELGDPQRRRPDGWDLPLPPYAVALTAAGKVLRFALAAHSGVSTKKGRAVVRLDAVGSSDDKVVGVEVTDGTENLCLATRSARVLIFPVAEATSWRAPPRE